MSRGLNNLGFRELSDEYNYPHSLTTHGTYLTTTVWFGDGRRKTVETYDRQGPLGAWSAQQMFLGLLAETTWTKEHRSQRCEGI